MTTAPPPADALESARKKAYLRLIPLVFICYVIAYVDRANVAIAKLTMSKDLPGFDNAVFGFGFGVFFIGYFLLEIPGSLLVERWSARKWISRIMITWGITAAATAYVTTPGQFYFVRFMLGLSEAGFYPGVIVYLTHWFTLRDRARALAYFFAATPVAQILSPKISNAILKIGTDETVNGVVVHHPELLGMEGWQWVYIFWGIPAVVLGVIVLFALTDRPRDARWLTSEEREALEGELVREHAAGESQKRHNLGEALRHPKVWALAGAYLLVVIGNYGMESFLPSILERWYSLKLDALTWLVLLPPTLALLSQLVVGWSSDRSGERRLHTVVPIALGAIAMAAVPSTQGNLTVTIICFMIAFAGLKAYLPAFWSLPNLFLSGSAAAGSIGLINSFGNLGGFVGPYVLGKLDVVTGSFEGGIYFMAITMALSAAVLFLLGLGNKTAKD